MLNNQKLIEVIKETQEEKEELEREMENDFVPAKDEKNIKKGHLYCGIDPTRPKIRKIGESGVIKSKLIKQYTPRYMPKGFKINQWVPFDNIKLAENNIFEKLKKYRINKTEYFEFNNMEDTDINNLINNLFNDYKKYIEN